MKFSLTDCTLKIVICVIVKCSWKITWRHKALGQSLFALIYNLSIYYKPHSMLLLFKCIFLKLAIFTKYICLIQKICINHEYQKLVRSFDSLRVIFPLQAFLFDVNSDILLSITSARMWWVRVSYASALRHRFFRRDLTLSDRILKIWNVIVHFNVE